MMKQLFFWMGLILFFSACEKDDKFIMPDFSSKELVITSGFVCGWCAGSDSIVLADNSFAYVSFNPCDPDETYSEKNSGLNSADWQQLVQLLDFDDFSSIDLNTCNVCVDGCDYWVRIRQDNETHQIRYGHSTADSLTLEKVMPFLEKLDELKTTLISE